MKTKELLQFRLDFFIFNLSFGKEQLWRAPELQSSYIGFNPNTASQLFVGTQKGDIYSFAIIVQEILYRKGVFYVNDEDRENTFKVNENYERNQTSNHIQVTYQGKIYINTYDLNIF